MPPIRICQLITELVPAGAERCVYELATRLNPEKFQVQVIALRGGKVAKWLIDAGIKVKILGMHGKWDVLKLRRRLRRWLQQSQPDILHTHLFHANLAARLALWPGHCSHRVHTVHITERRFRPGRFAMFLLTWPGEKLIAVSNAVADFHARKTHLPRSRYTVIHNGVDVEKFRPDPQHRRQLRQQWGAGDKDVVALFAGRLDHQKGLDIFLQAISQLHAGGREIIPVVAGQGPQEPMLREFIAATPAGKRTQVIGFVEDMSAVYPAADMLLMPSRWEGFGLVAIEAMATALPVIATDVPGPAEIVLHEQTGLLIRPDDVASLVGAVETLLDSPKKLADFGQAGMQRVSEHFSIQQFIAAHEQFYKSMLR